MLANIKWTVTLLLTATSEKIEMNINYLDIVMGIASLYNAQYLIGQQSIASVLPLPTNQGSVTAHCHEVIMLLNVQYH